MPDGTPNVNQAAVEAPAAVAAPVDRELLEAFRQRNDEAAFEALVRRHGPLVMGVCRRGLGNEHDAADAFQAVFLVLARKAASIRAAEVLSAWLHSVAVRTSLKARAVRQKRLAHEKLVIDMPEPVFEPTENADEALTVLDEEVRSLPEKYRVPVILCELEGRSRKEAAAILDLAEGTLSSRLAMARTKLAERLSGRGIAMSAVALGTLVAQSAAQASVPATLIAGTAKAAALLNAGQAAATVASAEVVALTDGVLKTMLIAKLKVVLAMFLATCLLSIGLVANLGYLADEGDPDEAAAIAALEKLGAKLTWTHAMRTKQEPVGAGGGVAPAPVVDEKPVKVLVGVDLTGKRFTDADLKYITPLSRLQMLNLKKTKVTDAGAKRIASVATLKMLHLCETAFGDAGLKDLAASPNLDWLALKDTAVTDAGVKELGKMSKLTSIWLCGTKVSDDGLKHLAPLNSLYCLLVERTDITDAGVKNLAPLAKLGMLSLDKTKVTNACLRDLAVLPNLRWLTVNRTKINDAGVPDIVALKKLDYLAIHDTAFTDAGLKQLGSHPNLRSLHISWTKVTNAGLKHLALLPNLRELRLGGIHVNDAGLKDVAVLKNLDTLWLDFTKITDDGLKELAAMPRLRELRLNNTAVTDEGLKSLAALQELKRVELQQTGVTPSGTQKLHAALGNATINVQDAAEEPAEAGGRSGVLGWLLGAVALLVVGGSIAWLQPRRKQQRAAESVQREPAPIESKEGTISFRCTGCERALKVKPELAGKKGKCPQCGHAILVPAAETAASSNMK